MKRWHSNFVLLTMALLILALSPLGAQKNQVASTNSRTRKANASPVPARAPQRPQNQAAQIPPTSDLLVFLTPGTDARQWAQQYGMTIVRQLKSDPDAYVFRATTPQTARDALRRIGPTASQSMMPQRHPQAAADARVRFAALDEIVPRDYQAFVPNDILFNANPLQDAYAGQWHLKAPYGGNLDINVWGAWQRDVTGQGVVTGILDDGIQTGHPDLSTNVAATDCWDFAGNDADPNPPDNSEKHGTAVAGIVAARGGNEIGVTGVAPYGSLAGLRLGASLSHGVDATLYHSSGANTNIKVKNHSYSTYTPFTTTGESSAVHTSTAAGTIHVWSAGNYRTSGAADSTKFLIQNDPDVICVSAIDSNAAAAPYSNYGACVTVTAPSAGNSGLDGIATTDLVGSNGYNGMTVAGFPIYEDYTDRFNGTSASAPMVSGVMALMKQVQPRLTTRLAKHLMSRTSRLLDTGNSHWTRNTAGIYFNPNYGFGLINADALTLFALYYDSVTPLTTESIAGTGVFQAIPDNNTNGLTRTFVVNSTTPMEEIQVTLNIAISNANHIGATLISPRGTSAVLVFPSQVDTDGKGNAHVPVDIVWTFTSNAYWGENPQGTWILRVYDSRAGVTGTWNTFAVDVRMGELVGRVFYVDKAFTGTELGTQLNPYRTVTAALNAVGANEGARIYIKAGNYGSDRPRTTKRVQFLNWTNTGQARIGKP